MLEQAWGVALMAFACLTVRPLTHHTGHGSVVGWAARTATSMVGYCAFAQIGILILQLHITCISITVTIHAVTIAWPMDNAFCPQSEYGGPLGHVNQLHTGIQGPAWAHHNGALQLPSLPAVISQEDFCLSHPHIQIVCICLPVQMQIFLSHLW